MLVLSRKLNERIMIDGGNIVVTVVELLDDKVRIGVSAPEEMIVDREEIHRERQRNPRKKGESA
jgi:carbon storage regulator